MADTFDHEALLETLDGDLEFLAETVEMLDEDAPGLLDAVAEAAAARDAAALVAPAHTLKGMLGNFCAADAQEAARVLEVMGREGALDGVDAAVVTLRDAIAALRADLKRFLAERA